MVLFRVDANEQVASGHLMRCISIAKEVRNMGEEVFFVLAQNKFTERLVEENIPFEVLHSDWMDLYGELSKISKVVQQKKPRWIVVDSYQAEEDYLSQLQHWKNVLYMDDLAKDIYRVAAVVHYADWEQESKYGLNYEDSNTKVLCGMKYVPLREEFYPEEGHATKRILITTGGTDGYNVAGRLLRKLCAEPELEDYRFATVVGALNANKNELQQLAKEKSQIDLLFDVHDMGEQMRKSQIAISAGGTTLFELCACRVPTVCFSMAENQENLAKAMGKHGVMTYAGDARFNLEQLVDNLSKEIRRLVVEEQLQQDYKQKMSSLVDGQGARRIAQLLVEGN